MDYLPYRRVIITSSPRVFEHTFGLIPEDLFTINIVVKLISCLILGKIPLPSQFLITPRARQAANSRSKV